MKRFIEGDDIQITEKATPIRNPVAEGALPTYDLLDPIIEAYVEDDKTKKEIIDSGFNSEDVKENKYVAWEVKEATIKNSLGLLGVNMFNCLFPMGPGYALG